MFLPILLINMCLRNITSNLNNLVKLSAILSMHFGVVCILFSIKYLTLFFLQALVNILTFYSYKNSIILLLNDFFSTLLILNYT